MAHVWDYDRALEHINKKIDDVRKVVIADYVRDTSLYNIPTNKAYKVDGVHMYADILNLDDMLNVTAIEGELCHKRTLRFLNLHYRAVHRILDRCNALRVDFHNQRLHALIAKPYNSEKDAEAKRIWQSVAIAQLITDVLAETGDDDEHIPNAKVRVGIDTGISMAVNNGRNRYREPLFLGNPANHAAKLAGGGRSKGIYLSNEARVVIGLSKVDEPKHTALTAAEIEVAQDEAKLDVTAAAIVQEWRDDLDNNPIGAFEFYAHTPPFSTIDITGLTPKNSRRQDAASIYADIDGFTAYVNKHIDNAPEDVVRALHVIRAELDRVLTTEFEGRRVRFIGDCVHGLLCEGTAQTTDAQVTVSTATLCAAGMRSSFDLALEQLKTNQVDASDLGLAIGFEYGPITLTRLGMQGDRVRCSISRGILAAENEQMGCDGKQTAIGPVAYQEATDAVRKLFGKSRKRALLDYNEAVESLSSEDDKSASAAKTLAYVAESAAIIKSNNLVVRPHAK
ncbi:adenylate and Guanylate cyclase catalytic domain protein [Collimonas fungivorans]|uniref:Adenylate and Guanylate cyclase catalytic domain protein n=1 Tax=Collimonas fungivorans TaxID=158899 RepID=A0A127P5T8_9BURK|nr:adenylate/guanylate cyclase domain-containing protein [Collimonas fungivorans]AMO93186.1 adenylate and Guanylate cyclase catalytic domain protein [Collimonas fungivorans]